MKESRNLIRLTVALLALSFSFEAMPRHRHEETTTEVAEVICHADPDGVESHLHDATFRTIEGCRLAVALTGLHLPPPSSRPALGIRSQAASYIVAPELVGTAGWRVLTARGPPLSA